VRRDLGAAWRFFTAAFRAFDQTASLFPSSRFLVAALTRHPELARARLVVELGPGVGTVTRGILRAMPADATLLAVEIDQALITAAAAAIQDPRLRWVHASAADLPGVLAAQGVTGPVDVIVSSLGMSLLPAPVRDAVLDGVTRVLAPGGLFVQYGYWHARVVVWSAERGFSRFDLRRYLAPRFRTLERRLVVANMPPAAVYTCRS
jgi:phospholipid N-methyltransferase